MSTAAVNPYEISMEELKRLAETAPEVTPESVTPPSVTEQPRDEQGRFIKVEESEPTVNESTETQTETEEATPVEAYTATIDLGDGSGVQVFEGKDKDELLQKLIVAQENATRKIRELTATKTAPVTPPVVEPTLNPDQEAELAQEFLSEPSKAFDKLYQKRRQEELAREAEARKQAEEAGKAELAAANAFMAANPDYFVCPQNGNRIDRVLKLNGWASTTENIQKAYDELKADGLLTAKPSEAAPVRTARTSGLSVRAAVQPPPKSPVDPSKLTLEQLRDLAGGYVYPQ